MNEEEDADPHADAALALRLATAAVVVANEALHFAGLGLRIGDDGRVILVEDAPLPPLTRKEVVGSCELLERARLELSLEVLAVWRDATDEASPQPPSQARRPWLKKVQ